MTPDPPADARTPSRSLLIRASREELDQLRHAASLRRVAVAEYIKRALNTQMRKEGVDAVLFRESDDV